MVGDTIVALGTPAGSSGVAVVRISGPRAIEIMDRVAPGAASWIPRTLHVCTLRSCGGEAIDEVVASVMRAPHSYTGEDSAEISCHGSMVIVERIIGEVVRLGARHAAPGEFTKRAFLSGRLDLAQAEAVADLISSETELQASVALEHLGGGFSRRLEEIEHELVGILTLIEASIDFAGEDIEVYTDEKVMEAARGARERIADLVESETAGGKLRSGVRIAIAGPRNAGKSSIYNALVGEERAIVSSIPGTTRDVLRERMHIKGFTFFLEDTAGLGPTTCEIETKGIAKGREATRSADLVLFVVDSNAGWDEGAFEELEALAGCAVIIVLNKIDLGVVPGALDVARKARCSSIVQTSALTSEGLDDLRDLIFRCTAESEAGRIVRHRIAVNARQSAALREAKSALERLEEEARAGAPAEILSIELRDALDSFGEILGRSASGAVLDEIFSRFCIGK